jgi:hypothetical protein
VDYTAKQSFFKERLPRRKKIACGARRALADPKKPSLRAFFAKQSLLSAEIASTSKKRWSRNDGFLKKGERRGAMGKLAMTGQNINVRSFVGRSGSCKRWKDSCEQKSCGMPGLSLPQLLFNEHQGDAAQYARPLYFQLFSG